MLLGYPNGAWGMYNAARDIQMLLRIYKCCVGFVSAARDF